MISEAEAHSKILKTIQPLPARRTLLLSALGCFAAEDHFARLPLPNFDNSAMDGYAVVASSCRKGERLLVTGEQPAGPDRQLRISPGEAVRIFTGAPMPAGAEAVVMVASGDELMNVGEQLKSGQVYESNSALLQALLKSCGAIVKSAEHSRDDRELLIETIERGLKNHVLIISGGVSVGEHDLVQSTLRSLGAKIDVWRVAIKPGKPFLFGRIGDCFVFGLPGNPVSAFVTFLQFVRPAILRMMGAADLDLLMGPAKLIADLTNGSDRPHYVRGKLEDGKFTPVGRQESHALLGLSQSNALLPVAVVE